MKIETYHLQSKPRSCYDREWQDFAIYKTLPHARKQRNIYIKNCKLNDWRLVKKTSEIIE